MCFGGYLLEGIHCAAESLLRCYPVRDDRVGFPLQIALGVEGRPEIRSFGVIVELIVLDFGLARRDRDIH